MVGGVNGGSFFSSRSGQTVRRGAADGLAPWGFSLVDGDLGQRLLELLDALVRDLRADQVEGLEPLDVLERSSPLSVTWVRLRASTLRFLRSLSWARPASPTLEPVRKSMFRFGNALRLSSAASVTCGLINVSELRPGRSFKAATAASLNWPLST